ncbi:hypothetical protein DENSPDRAFT_881688 [Dentipellis sp. KUC8613]|nr:hypothetical protein DENSPDRAFT_881688 [Dentipellis sp. KUC8613]
MLFVDMSYCAMCDKYFPTADARAQHVQMSKNHPECGPCKRRFSNKNALRTHFAFSNRHHYCSVCEIDFRSAAGLRVHIETASVHRDDSDDDEEEDESELDEPPPGWEDEYGERVYPEENEAAAAALAAEEAQEAGGAISKFDSSAPIEEYWDEDEFHPEEYTDAELAAGVAALRDSNESCSADAGLVAVVSTDPNNALALGFPRADGKTPLPGIDAEEAIEELAKYFEVVEVAERRRASV